MKKFLSILILLFGFTVAGAAQDRNPLQAEQAKIIKFYPNPANSAINFDFQKGYKQDYSIQIYNLLGKKVLDIKKLTPRTVVNLESLYKGLYIFKLTNGNGAIVESGKFQIVK